MMPKGTLLLVLLLAAYLALFFGFTILAIWWLRKRRKRRSPFKTETKLLRGPGETLLNKIAKLDEEMVLNLIGVLGVPILAAGLFSLLLKWLGFTDAGVRTWATFAMIVVTLAIGCFDLVRRLIIRANHFLGYFGERVVAQALEPLKSDGWHVFHDIPAAVGKKTFNVDHVAVGPGGVFAIETKARRKGGAIAGRDDNKVVYDGRKMKWPWGDEEPHGVQQAVDRARWLAGWLEQLIGKPVPVHTILTLPEWYVVEQPKRVDPRLRVLPSAWLADEIRNSEVVFNDRQIDFVARQLEQKCRDVEY